MKEVQIAVRDYQIIEKADVTAEGLTCVIGPSNSGKTALFRALDSCVHNATGDHFVRRPDAKESKVSVRFIGDKVDDDLFVAWKKPIGTGATYNINGEEHRVVGRGSLDDVLKHGLAPLDTRRNSYKLNFWSQGTLFLVNETETKIFDLINELMSEKELVPVLAQMKSDSRDLKTDMTATEKTLEDERKQVEDIQAQIIKLNTVDADDPELKELKSLRNGVVLAEHALDELTRAETFTSEAKARLDVVQPLVKKLTTALGLIEPDFKLWVDATKMETEVSKLANENKVHIDKLADVTVELEALESVDGLSEDVRLWTTAKEYLTLLEDQQLASNSYMLEADQVVKSLKSVTDQIIELESKLGVCAECGAPTIEGTYCGGSYV